MNSYVAIVFALIFINSSFATSKFSPEIFSEIAQTYKKEMGKKGIQMIDVRISLPEGPLPYIIDAISADEDWYFNISGLEEREYPEVSDMDILELHFSLVTKIKIHGKDNFKLSLIGGSNYRPDYSFNCYLPVYYFRNTASSETIKKYEKELGIATQKFALQSKNLLNCSIKKLPNFI